MENKLEEYTCLADEIPNDDELRVTEKQMERPKYFECDGVKWMRTNLGASTETEYGLYYPWGGTIGYEDASVCTFSDTDPLSNMLYHKSETELKAMGVIDNNGNLTPEYDAVTQALGNGWRMPTIDDLMSLLVNTDLAWTKNFNGSGVSGVIFFLKDRRDYLFIPASGYIHDGSVQSVGLVGNLWSSSVSSSYTWCAYDLNFYKGNVNPVRIVLYYFKLGFPLRGVKTANN